MYDGERLFMVNSNPDDNLEDADNDDDDDDDFGDFAKTRAAGPPVTRFCSDLHQNFCFFHVVSKYAKNSKIGPKKLWGGPPP